MSASQDAKERLLSHVPETVSRQWVRSGARLHGADSFDDISVEAGLDYLKGTATEVISRLWTINNSDVLAAFARNNTRIRPAAELLHHKNLPAEALPYLEAVLDGRRPPELESAKLRVLGVVEYVRQGGSVFTPTTYALDTGTKKSVALESDPLPYLAVEQRLSTLLSPSSDSLESQEYSLIVRNMLGHMGGQPLPASEWIEVYRRMVARVPSEYANPFGSVDNVAEVVDEWLRIILLQQAESLSVHELTDAIRVAGTVPADISLRDVLSRIPDMSGWQISRLVKQWSECRPLTSLEAMDALQAVYGDAGRLQNVLVEDDAYTLCGEQFVVKDFDGLVRGQLNEEPTFAQFDQVLEILDKLKRSNISAADWKRWKGPLFQEFVLRGWDSWTHRERDAAIQALLGREYGSIVSAIVRDNVASIPTMGLAHIANHFSDEDRAPASHELALRVSGDADPEVYDALRVAQVGSLLNESRPIWGPVVESLPENVIDALGRKSWFRDKVDWTSALLMVDSSVDTSYLERHLSEYLASDTRLSLNVVVYRFLELHLYARAANIIHQYEAEYGPYAGLMKMSEFAPVVVHEMERVIGDDTAHWETAVELYDDWDDTFISFLETLEVVCE